MSEVKQAVKATIRQFSCFSKASYVDRHKFDSQNFLQIKLSNIETALPEDVTRTINCKTVDKDAPPITHPFDANNEAATPF